MEFLDKTKESVQIQGLLHE